MGVKLCQIPFSTSPEVISFLLLYSVMRGTTLGDSELSSKLTPLAVPHWSHHNVSCHWSWV